MEVILQHTTPTGILQLSHGFETDINSYWFSDIALIIALDIFDNKLVLRADFSGDRRF